MRYKITYRLVAYFSAVLILFSISIGALFAVQFTRHTARIHEEELREQAVSIADTLSIFLQRHPGRSSGGQGFGAYLRFIDDISDAQAWLVDEDAQTIELSTPNYSLSYETLPPGAEELIRQIFKGNVVSSRVFSSVLGIPSITVGAPVYDKEGTVSGAFLLHSPVNGIKDAEQQSLVILTACIFFALVLAFALSILLARHFITPLKEIGQATEQVMAGDYSARARVNQNDEIGDLADNINELFAQLSDIEKERKKLDKMQQDFTSNISHELRTPITVIRGSLEVLKEGLIRDPGEINEYYEQMLSDTLHLQRLVNDLLELSRLQNSDFNIIKTDLSLTDLLTDTVRSMQRIAGGKHVGIQLDNQAGLVVISGDYNRLRQMFITILDNSIKFSPPHTVINVRMYCENSLCIISFTDYGSGILPQDLPYIFNRFYKKTSEQNENGSGLGLPIAKQIADRHNITITWESELEDHTTFFFAFPEGTWERFTETIGESLS